MKEMPDLICGKAAVGGNYNSTRDIMMLMEKNFIMIFSGNSMRLILGIKTLVNYVYKIFARTKMVFTFQYLK